MPNSNLSFKQLILRRITDTSSDSVWTPADFLDLGSRDAVDKALQRLVATHKLRRIDRGLYDKPRLNSLTSQLNTPNYKSIINAIGRRDQIRILIDGMTCANDLGLTNAVPGQVIVHTDARLRPIKIGNLIIQFKLTAPSKLYWANRPAMHIIQALYWLRDAIKNTEKIEQDFFRAKLIRLLKKSKKGSELRKDIQSGLHTLPAWMQKWIRELLY
ncbi:MAG: hypothetical protein HY939_04680 [Gammaproteobacteria bacterium]|nr:hypothetical protein [Gammaproteobacteria bacterium]